MFESPTNQWDDWLRDGLVTPPADFHAKVMAQVVLQSPHLRRGRVRLAAEVFALSAAAMAGLAQLAIFSFGIWSATAAG